MKKIYAISLLLLLAFTGSLASQTFRQLGFYGVAGNLSLDARSGIMVLGTGHIVDISDPSSPVLLGRATLTTPANAVIIHQGYAFFGSETRGMLAIVDISDPRSPVTVATLSFPGAEIVFSMAIAGDFLFMAMSSPCIHSVDISDVENPVVAGTLPTEWVFDIALRGGYAYVSGYDNGLQVVDISDPANMQVVAAAGEDYFSVELAGNLAFLGSDSHGGVHVYDISDPLLPLLVAAAPSIGEGQHWDLKYHGGHLFAATRSHGLLVYKIDNGTATHTASFHHSGMGQCYAVCIPDSLLLLSTFEQGIFILHYDSTPPTATRLPARQAPVTVFPNPAREQLSLSNVPPWVNRLEVIDMHGNVVLDMAGGPFNTRLALPALPAGNYLIRLSGTNGIITRRFIRLL